MLPDARNCERMRLLTEEACLGREHDGRFTLPNVVDLLQLGRQLARLHQPHEFASQLAGYCTLQLWLSLCEEGGQESFCNWCAAFIPCVCADSC